MWKLLKCVEFGRLVTVRVELLAGMAALGCVLLQVLPFPLPGTLHQRSTIICYLRLQYSHTLLQYVKCEVFIAANVTPLPSGRNLLPPSSVVSQHVSRSLPPVSSASVMYDMALRNVSQKQKGKSSQI
jgi:hypothetical protein